MTASPHDVDRLENLLSRYCDGDNHMTPLDVGALEKLIAAYGAMEAAAHELDRWSLVIESAVRNDAPRDHSAVVNALLAIRTPCSPQPDHSIPGALSSNNENR